MLSPVPFGDHREKAFKEKDLAISLQKNINYSIGFVMKTLRLFFIIAILPLALQAMTLVSDEDLSNITGQAGVNINPNLTMDISLGTIAWGDADGIAGPCNPWEPVPSGGYVGVNNFNITNLTVRMRTDPDDHWNGYSTLMQKPITVDVATGTKLGVPDTTFIRIGTGAMKISTDEMQFDVALRPHKTSPVLNQALGTVTLGPMDVFVNPQSSVDVYSPSKHGVAFDVNVTLDRIKIPYMSWGNGQ